MVFEFIATLSASIFAGAAIYINFVEHPARMSCGAALAITEFAPSYKRGTVMQGSLAAISFLSALTSWLMHSSISWLIGGILIGLVIPFTLIFILPTNKKLLDSSLKKDSKLAEELLIRWGRLHAVRSFLSLIAFLIFLYTLIWA